jgi:type I restriction enzyme S subunit
VSRGRSPDYAEDESGVPVINQACIYWDGLRLDKVKWHRSETLRGERGALERGDLLLNSTGTGTLGRAAIFAGNGRFVADSHVTIVRAADGTEPRFVRYVLQTDIYQGFIYSVLAPGATNQVELSREGLRNTPFPMPPAGEQRAIADVLDRKTAAIDALIANKERLLEAIAEKRRVVITTALTRGLDEDTSLKDSGVEWLGQIPGHWSVRALGHALDFISYGFTNPMPSTDEGPYMLTANDIGDGEVKYDTARHTDLGQCLRLTRKSRPAAGDILLTKDGTLGRVAVSDGRPSCVNQSVAVLHANDRIATVDFLQNALRAELYQARMMFEAGGTAIKHIYITRLAKMPVAFPPLEEQARICSDVNTVRRRLDALSAKVTASVAVLREYRQALITAAVTGQLDVSAQSQEAA